MARASIRGVGRYNTCPDRIVALCRRSRSAGPESEKQTAKAPRFGSKQGLIIRRSHMPRQGIMDAHCMLRKRSRLIAARRSRVSCSSDRCSIQNTTDVHALANHRPVSQNAHCVSQCTRACVPESLPWKFPPNGSNGHTPL